jgi:hypothetical protein
MIGVLLRYYIRSLQEEILNTILDSENKEAL